MRQFCWMMAALALLAACHGKPTSAGAADWAATIAARLYERQILTAAGRDELQRRIAAGQLRAEYTVPGSEDKRYYQAASPATVLAFCGDAFQAELSYRLGTNNLESDLYIAGQAPDSAAMRAAQQRFAALLREAKGDTDAVLRRAASPGQLLEEKIKAEDSVDQSGWTIYPPLSYQSGLPPHCIADTRSIFGKTRTRTARDFYDLGLLTKVNYQLVSKELASGELESELAVCERAAQLALADAVHSARELALDSVLGNLQKAGILTAANRKRALADPQLRQTLKLFDVLPYCTYTRVLNLHTLPREPARLYPRLLAEVAAIWPAFRYTSAQAVLREQDSGDDVLDEQVTLQFVANGRPYVTTFIHDYRRKDDQDPDPATGAKVGHDFIAGINQWLRDQGATERLYLAYRPDDRSVYGDDWLGLTVLTPAQHASWGPAQNFISPPEEVAITRQFTSAYIEKALALYQRIGLFKGLTPSQIAAGRREALSGKTNSFADVLQGFPHLLVATGGEDAELPQAYAKALREVAASTRGAFRPTHIRDSFSGQQARHQQSVLSFRCGPRQYRFDLVSDLGWMDFGFLPLLERTVRENTQGGQLCLLVDDESSVYVFLTAAQTAALRKAQPAFFTVADEEAKRRTAPQTLSEDLPF